MRPSRHIPLPAAPRRPRRARTAAPRAFTLVEMLIVILIMAITASLGVDAISGFEAAERPTRAARECLQAFRFARQLAVATGKSAKVSFNTSTNSFSVYWMSNGSTWDASPVAQPAFAAGVYTVTMSNSFELAGVTLSLNPAGTTNFTYNPVGSLDNASVVTFTYGSKSKTLTVNKVGDPIVN